MSWFTVGEIVSWLVLAALLGVVLGWLLHAIWARARRASSRPSGAEEIPAVPTGPPALADPPTERPAEAAAEPAAEPRIKGKLKSKIYHVPGSPMYERTHADVWFSTEDQARGAGFRRPKNQ